MRTSGAEAPLQRAYRHAAPSHARLSRSRRAPPAGQAHPTSLTRPSTSVCPPRPRRSVASAQLMRRSAAPSNRVRHSVPRPAPASQASESSGGPSEPAWSSARAQMPPGELPPAPAPQTAELAAPAASGGWHPAPAATATGLAGASAPPPPPALCAAPLPGAFLHGTAPAAHTLAQRPPAPPALPNAAASAGGYAPAPPPPVRPATSQDAVLKRDDAPPPREPQRDRLASLADPWPWVALISVCMVCFCFLVIFAPPCPGKRTLTLFSPGAPTPSNRRLASRVASPSPHHPPHDSHDPRLPPPLPPSSRQAVSRCP